MTTENTRNMGKNMKDALTFARKYAGWHSYDRRNRATVAAVRRLAARGLVEMTAHQFRATELHVAAPVTAVDRALDRFAELKAATPETVLVFRLGDFYEMLHGDAQIGRKVLGLGFGHIPPARRPNHPAGDVLVAGFPYHMAAQNIDALRAAGYKVQVVEG